MRGRARADRGPLLLTGAVVALTTVLASAVPVLMPRTGSEAVRDAVIKAGDQGKMIVDAEFMPLLASESGGWVRSSEVVGTAMDAGTAVLGPELEAVALPPQVTISSSTLAVAGFGPGRLLQLAYVTSPAGEPAVTWVKGGAPKAAVPQNRVDRAVAERGEQWTAQVGLSEATAAELKVVPGDELSATDIRNGGVQVRISGIFRATDPADPRWQDVPRLLSPLDASDGSGTRIEMAALLSADSVPDARLAMTEGEMHRKVTFDPNPELITWDRTEALIGAVLKRQSGTNPIAQGWESTFTFNTGLGPILAQARSQGVAAGQQASVLLIALIGTAALILLLAADLLMRRRTAVLTVTRMRGASLPGIGAELLIESIAVTAVGVGLSLLGSLLLTGDCAWVWLLPVAAVAVLGGPLLGMRAAAAATAGRRAPANRSARQSDSFTGQLRRVALETAVVLVAAAAFTALRQRGVVTATPDDGGNLLSAMAPTLGAVTGALILVRLMPPAVRLAVTRAGRYRGSLPLLAAARAAVTAARPLPLIVLVLSSALLTFSLALAATESGGQEQGSWRSVGADARLDLPESVDLPQLAQRVAAKDGIDQALSAHLADGVSVSSNTTNATVRLVAVHPAAFEKLLAATPLPDAPQLSRLRRPVAAGGPLPALLRITDPRFQPGSSLLVSWNGGVIPLTDVGPAPAVGDGEAGVLIVDETAFKAAAEALTGGSVAPNTVWVLGSQARTVIHDVIGDKGTLTIREELLSERLAAPLAEGIYRLALVSALVLVLFGLLSTVLAAAAGAPARGEMLARLRTLGLRPGQARRVALGELLPPVIGGALGGLLIGVLLAQATLGQLALRLVTGQATDPDLVVPWFAVVPVLLVVAAVVLGVGVESSVRRRERLGQVLRAGNQ